MDILCTDRQGKKSSHKRKKHKVQDALGERHGPAQAMVEAGSGDAGRRRVGAERACPELACVDEGGLEPGRRSPIRKFQLLVTPGDVIRRWSVPWRLMANIC